ncbi:MAG: DUF4097 family beta strand repeat-containing protein [Candidatus Aminicenantes bacterium]|nr:DUF4097 family beta strand repeat-containing protein [Candidatus Aminicenantes bacterium]
MSIHKKTFLVPFALLMIAATAAPFLQADYREEVVKSFPLRSGGSFSLDNTNGSVKIVTWAEDRVEIRALKIARKDKEDLAEVQIEFDATADAVTVRAVWPKVRRNLQVSVSFDVHLPAGIKVADVETTNGNLDLRGEFASARVGTTNGGIVLEGCRGEVRAGTTNGTIEVDGAEGRIEVESTNGDIQIRNALPKDGLDAETTNGNITLNLAAPDKINADLSVRTTNGHIETDVPVTLHRLTKSRHSLEARIGAGGPAIRLSTTNGSIRITR